MKRYHGLAIAFLSMLSILVQPSVWAGEAAAPATEDASSRELIGDPHFQRGCVLWEPQPGRHVEYGRLSGIDGEGDPIWGLAQWSSKQKLVPDSLEVLPSGARRYANAAKSVVFGLPGTEDADVSLGVVASVEYDGHVRKQGEPWVHLLLEQRFSDPPALSELTHAHFHIEARKKAFRKHDMPGYSPGLHAAQNQIFFTVSNTNRASSGYGKLLWFGVPIFDDRERSPRAYRARDFATGDDSGMFIYTLAARELTAGSLHDEGWVALDGDLRAAMRAGLEAAWKAGFLNESHSLGDYHITGMNMGWEVPGTFDVEIQYRGLSLKVTTGGTPPGSSRRDGQSVDNALRAWFPAERMEHARAFGTIRRAPRENR